MSHNALWGGDLNQHPSCFLSLRSRILEAESTLMPGFSATEASRKVSPSLGWPVSHSPQKKAASFYQNFLLGLTTGSLYRMFAQRPPSPKI
jgi:hypothetical protein